MTSGYITRDKSYTLLWNDFVYYFGQPLDLFGGGGDVAAYTGGTGSLGWALPPAAQWMPAGEGLQQISFYCPSGNDGWGWVNYGVIEGSGVFSANNGLNPYWNPPSLLGRSQVDALGLRVRLQVVYGGQPNTFARVGHDSYANGSGWFGNWYVAFTTAAFPASGVTTNNASNVGAGGATLNGALVTGGYSHQYWFEWGRTTAYGNSTSVGTSSANVNPSANIAGLIPGAEYHFRLAAKNVNSGQITYGADNTLYSPSGLVAVVG